MTNTENALVAAGDLPEVYLDLLKNILLRSSNGSTFLAADPVDDDPLRVPSMEEIENGVAFHPEADTMIGRPRLDNVQECVTSVLLDGVPGDLVETGVWRGGTAVFMRAILRVYGVRDRSVWLADSFEGFPRPDPVTYPMDAVYLRGDSFAKELVGETGISLEDVRSRFAAYQLLDDQVQFLPGFFSESLPRAPIDQISVLRLDGDFYQSTWEALDALYPKLAPGGYCLVDDYWLTTCRKAVDDYRSKHGIDEPIEIVDWTGVYWRKARG